MTVSEQLKVKAETLRIVQGYINELIKTRNENTFGNFDELKEVNRYIDEMITSYKQLASDLRKQYEQT